MDRRTLEKQLARIERDLAAAEKAVTRQQDSIRKLQDAGQDTAEARRLLGGHHQIQLARLADRERLKKELAKLKKG